jgi:hypothetical protein
MLIFVIFIHCPAKVGALGRVGVSVLYFMLIAVDFVGGLAHVSTGLTQSLLLLSNCWNMTLEGS